jgi:hypothetical protein
MTIVQATDAARPVSKAGRAAFDRMAAGDFVQCECE